MNKNVTVRISVDEPILTYEKDTRWELLEKHAGNCPIPHYSTGYCFNRSENGQILGRPFREYNYRNLSDGNTELIRIYWTNIDMEIGIGFGDVVVDIWDTREEWPILDAEKIEVRGLE